MVHEWTVQIGVMKSSDAGTLSQKPKADVWFADLDLRSVQHLSGDGPAGLFISVSSVDEAATALKGWVKGLSEAMAWGSDNLAVGLLLARRSKKRLLTDLGVSPTINFVSSGRYLIACEGGNELAQDQRSRSPLNHYTRIRRFFVSRRDLKRVLLRSIF